MPAFLEFVSAYGLTFDVAGTVSLRLELTLNGLESLLVIVPTPTGIAQLTHPGSTYSGNFLT